MILLEHLEDKDGSEGRLDEGKLQRGQDRIHLTETVILQVGQRTVEKCLEVGVNKVSMYYMQMFE